MITALMAKRIRTATRETDPAQMVLPQAALRTESDG